MAATFPCCPEVTPGHGWLWEAWAYLQSGRRWLGGMGVVPMGIAAADIDILGDRLRLGAGRRAVLHQVIEALDAFWRDWQQKKAEAQRQRSN
ncbi:hypothetical protein [Rhodovarius lipocyclicus]|uniref:hypothetical protein n=1 Tax=Rhodovarius lipocyclicus TaxID=268410 RepID=UPI00135C36F1|nr:hypothetical protein [Rhodovarius lipocyclicus]